ncbi:MAG: hypothetical protein ACOYEW_04485 [Anaerolineae bacterium]|jgi:hypothetical protein
MTETDRTRLVAFRLAAHHLDGRLPRGSLLQAASLAPFRGVANVEVQFSGGG